MISGRYYKQLATEYTQRSYTETYLSIPYYLQQHLGESQRREKSDQN